jgi:murein L,D-transpeptidase YcbB/YkuD
VHRKLSLIFGAAAAIVAAPISFAAPAEARAAAIARDQGVEDFYNSRDERPLWFAGGQMSPAAQQLIQLLRSASIDGLDPNAYRLDGIDKLLAKASRGNPGAVRKADRMLSEAFVAYARDLRSGRSPEVQYVDPLLRSATPTPRSLLQMATSAPSLTGFVSAMGWMNPAYAPLRRALASGEYDGERERGLLQINLQRARGLPAGMPRYLIVNAAEQRLYMYEGDKPVGSMKVVVGQQKDDRKTPMMAGYLRYASLNPYWNVPPDLVWDDVGVHVKEYGLGYLKSRGYEVLSDWSDNAVPIDPATVDWDAVRDGRIEIRVRQKPGPRNVLGKVKYTFTNPFGVYLHDTSAKELLSHDTRLYSGGCIRLEDAARLGEWLFGHELKATSDEPDIKVPLAQPVPVYVTYLTAVPNGSSITFLDDVYGWDAQRLAQMGSSGHRVAAR